MEWLNKIQRQGEEGEREVAESEAEIINNMNLVKGVKFDVNDLLSLREDNPVEIIKGFEVINISLIISKLVKSPDPIL